MRGVSHHVEEPIFIDYPIHYSTITDLFLQRNLIHDATAILLDVLKPNLPKHGFLQTKVLEINLVTFPNVANAILAKGMFSHYDCPRVAQLYLTHYLYTNNMHRYIEGYVQKVAKVQVGEGLVSDAIKSFIRADDATHFLEVIKAVEDANVYHDLVKYILMVRKNAKEPKVDNELIYAYFKIDRLGKIEEFILMPNVANLPNVGDRLYDEALYEAAKIILSFISNCAKLAITLVKLQQFQGSVDASRKVNSSKTWKEVCFAYVDAEEFRVAQICGLNIIIQVDDLEEVSEFYHNRGSFNELISLRESGLGLECGHMGIFTELRVLYARHCHEKLMEHIKLFSTRLNIPKLIRACDEQQHWKELTYLYIQYDEIDNVATTILNHSPDARDHM
ncbi:hypothetical protein VNO77_02589 [Canavalia gladiata]|uniref:Clathrin heavy chain n=1 Tax=Canavalia gladiata TaxID=3824 RepID=A0AAN9MTX5_CANGL